MRKFIHMLVAAIVVGCASSGALACGQVDACELSKPGATIKIRGYGYGFEGGDRPVLLRWAVDRSLAATSKIDENGDFEASITVPLKPGLHQLIVLQGDGDPTPVDVTVPVALAWYQDLAGLPERVLTASPAGTSIAVLAGGLLFGFWRWRRMAADSARPIRG